MPRLYLIALALLFVVACSDDTVDEKKRPECEFGERFNAVSGRCVPAVGPGVDLGNNTLRDTNVSSDAQMSEDASPDTGTTSDMDDAPDLNPNCTGNERRCNANTVEVCVNGMFQLNETCQAGFICERGNCIPEDALACTPGATRCQSNTIVETCLSDETWGDAAACEANETCVDGMCTTGCAGFIDAKSNVGCEYITMRHHQATGIRTLPHTVVVSNPATDPVTIDVSSPGGLNPNIAQQTIQPLMSAVLNFPTSPEVSTVGLSSNFYIIRSSLPVIATQFSPLNNPGLGSETSDASLLLPTNAIGKEYVVVGWPSLQPGGTYVDIVALEDATSVTVTSPVRLSGGSAGNVSAGGTTTFTVNANQVLHLAENLGLFSTGSRDVSGVQITSDKPVSVYTGATISNIPQAPVRSNPPMSCTATGGGCTVNDDCCSGLCGHVPQMSSFECKDSFAAGDHLEQQLFPVDSWGSTYIAVPFPSRSVNDFTLFRVIGGTNSTNVTIDPPVDGLSSFTLNRGEMREFSSTSAFELSADRPVMLAQFMIGGDASSSLDGDPAFLGAAAVEQFRDSYVFLVPGNYRKNRVTLLKRSGAQITLDGTVVAQSNFTAVGGSSTWEHATINSVAAGVHTADSTQSFGIVVHGVDEYISYAFAGGITLPDP